MNENKPWFMWGQRELSLLDRIKLLFGWRLYVRFDAPSGHCSAACDLSHLISRKKLEQIKWPASHFKPPKACPTCGEVCQHDDLKCDECGHDL